MRQEYVNGLTGEMLGLIVKDPSTFPSFCYYDTPDFMRKVDQVVKMGFDVSLG